MRWEYRKSERIYLKLQKMRYLYKNYTAYLITKNVENKAM